MMSDRPTETAEVAELVRTSPRVVAVGGGTKAGLVGDVEGQRIELAGLSGITEYDASEFTFTAKAGTRVAEVCAALEEKGQYLPFDPHWVEVGATLGGTVAAGISGPGRFRYGGLRDFLLGVEFVDGTGAVVRAGGRVVKNAAGFDLPKFLVGSLGSFGVMTELTFKVFPVAAGAATVRVECGSAAEAVRRIEFLAKGRFEAEAVEYDAGDGAVYVRLGAPEKALDALCGELVKEWSGEVERLEFGRVYWEKLREMSWAEGKGCLVKVPLAPSLVAGLEERVGACRRHYSSAGAQGWLAFDEGEKEDVDVALGELGLRGLELRSGQRWLGEKGEDKITAAVKLALDPEGRFPSI